MNELDTSFDLTTKDLPPPVLPVREDWLALHDEPILEPGLPIIDPHHHLWHRKGMRYLVNDFLEDISGHNVLAALRDRIYQDVRKAMQADNVLTPMKTAGIFAEDYNPEQFKKDMERETAQWRKVIEDAGIQAD